MNPISRRQVLSSIGLVAGAGLCSGFGRDLHSAPQAEDVPTPDWNYTHLDPETIAAEAYRLFADGGCMYGLFGAVVTGLASKLGEPFRSFPLHMMRYGKGGVVGWGSLCGTLNGGAAAIGLVEPDKERREQLVAELFSWYETTALPTYKPKGQDGSPAMAKSVAESVLCHVSVHRWCEASGCEVESDEMKERCRRLTADVGAKTVELLNQNLQKASHFAGLAPEVKSCVACHGKDDRADAFGTMRCNTCHQLSKDHPDDN
jgi:Putative redox-active protein (C_GCAxxG_C_C)